MEHIEDYQVGKYEISYYLEGSEYAYDIRDTTKESGEFIVMGKTGFKTPKETLYSAEKEVEKLLKL